MPLVPAAWAGLRLQKIEVLVIPAELLPRTNVAEVAETAHERVLIPQSYRGPVVFHIILCRDIRLVRAEVCELTVRKLVDSVILMEVE